MSAPLRIQYLARRNPRFAAEEWIAVWRAHWELAASQPESATVRRYIQSEVLFDAGPAPHHAVASAEYWSPAAREANRGATGYHEIMRADEARVFERVIRECSFIGTHHVISGSGTGPFKVVRFFRDAGPRPEMASWGDRAAALHPEVLGYALNIATEPETPAGWGLAVAGSEEYWFDDPETATAFLLSGILRRATADAPLAVSEAVVTNEVILKDVR